MKSWYEIYLDEIKNENGMESYVRNKIITKKSMVKLITCYMNREEWILEAGCGTGIISTYLASLGYNVIGIDIDNSILKLAREISEKYSKIKSPCFETKSIFDLSSYSDNQFKVCFSSGVLEHFTDKEIITTIQEQLRISKYVVISIPTKYFKPSEALYGNERFLPLKKWRTLISASGGKILKEKSGHFLKFPMNCMKISKWFRPWPYRIFLVEKK